MNEWMLTPQESRKACDEFQMEHWRECDEYESCQDCPVNPKAAQKKLLDWLEQEGIARHDSGDIEEDCRLCQLRKDIE